MQETQNTPLQNTLLDERNTSQDKETSPQALLALINVKLMERRRSDYIAIIILMIVGVFFLSGHAYLIINPTYPAAAISYPPYLPIVLLVTVVALIAIVFIDLVYTSKNLKHLQRSYLSYNKIYIKICEMSMILDIFAIIFSIIRILNPFAWLLNPARQIEYLTGGINSVMSLGISALLVRNARRLDIYLHEYFELIGEKSYD